MANQRGASKNTKGTSYMFLLKNFEIISVLFYWYASNVQRNLRNKRTYIPQLLEVCTSLLSSLLTFCGAATAVGVSAFSERAGIQVCRVINAVSSYSNKSEIIRWQANYTSESSMMRASDIRVWSQSSRSPFISSVKGEVGRWGRSFGNDGRHVKVWEKKFYTKFQTNF